MNRIIGVGDNVVDIYLDMNRMFPGGNALNVSVLARKSEGVEAGYLGILGDDRAGRHVLQSLISEGIDVSRVRVEKGSNAFARVTLIDGDRVFVGSDTGVSRITELTEEDYEYIKTFDVIHTSVYSSLEAFLPKLSRLGKIAFDFSDRKDEDYLKKVCPYVNFAFLSGSDMTANEISELQMRIAELGPQVVLVTRGAAGALLYINGEIFETGIEVVEVTDTLGAGDAYIARLLVGIMKGEPILLTLEACKKASAAVCSHYGAFGYPLEI